MNTSDKFRVKAQDAYNYVASKFFADQQLFRWNKTHFNILFVENL